MYLGFVTFYINCTSLIYIDIYIYNDVVCFSPLSHMCYFFSLFIHMFLILYNFAIFHTRCLDGSCLMF